MRKKKKKESSLQKRNVVSAKVPRISLCMIVRNEEQVLGRCLGSARDYVDEIIVVDTGSTDRTLEIAEGFGAKVYRHPWANDFSEHKNQAIGYATGDWIFILDADEELKRGSGSVLREVARNDNVDAVIVTIISYFNNKASQSWESKVRFFRNRTSIRFKGIVHEQLRGYESPGTYPIYLYHYGYDLGKAALNEKFERTSHLLKRQIRQDPGNYWHHLNLAVAYASNFMFREAIIEGKAALDLAAKKGYTDHNVLWACYIVSSAFFKLADYESAEQYALEAAKLSSPHLDSYFMLVLVYHKQKDWEKLLEAARKFLEIQRTLTESPQEFAYMILNSANEEWRVRLALADLYLHAENRRLAVAEFKKALAVTPNQSECYRIMGDVYRDNGSLDQAEICLGRALKLNPDSIKTLTNLGHLYFEKGDFQSAINPYERAVQLAPGLMDVSLRLATIYLFQGNPDGCVAQCDLMLKSLNLPRNLLLNSIEDLALVFLTIAKNLTKEPKTHLAKEAVQIAVRLAPELVKECEKDPEMIESAFQGSGT